MKLFGTAPQIKITNEKLAAVIDILQTVGLDKENDFGFSYYILESDSYFGKTFEWTERFKGTRFYVTRDWKDNIIKVEVASHGGKPDETMAAAIVKANVDLKAIFA